MKAFLIGCAVGYVLGARAGRERYEQIVKAYRAVVSHPTVQGGAHAAQVKVKEVIGRSRPHAHSR